MFDIFKNTKIHFIGIGGIGMSGIAQVLLEMDYVVSGSDLRENSIIKRLKDMGAKISIGHRAENIDDPTVVVYSSAINKDNLEMLKASKMGIPCIRRAEMLSELMRLKFGVAVAGTHGKTTTTSFLATILHESKMDSTHIIGGIVENLEGHSRVGKGDILVAEADESDGSFLLLGPIMAVITNIDDDHLNYYKNQMRLNRAFLNFANRVPFYGCVAINLQDKRLKKMHKEIKRPCVTFGLEGSNAHYMALNILYKNECCIFDLYHLGQFASNIEICLPGIHNVLNSLGAMAIAHQLGISFKQIAKAITKFKGVGRRLEKLFKNETLEIIDDYAHHPTEILNTLQVLRKIKKDKIIALFEPHRYSRTHQCWSDFLHCFNAATELHVLPIYAASEEKIGGVNSFRLVEDINKLHPGLAFYIDDFSKIKGILKREREKGMGKITLVTLGAGSIGRNIRELLKDGDFS